VEVAAQAADPNGRDARRRACRYRRLRLSVVVFNGVGSRNRVILMDEAAEHITTPDQVSAAVR
jgi:hypothetical protein